LTDLIPTTPEQLLAAIEEVVSGYLQRLPFGVAYEDLLGVQGAISAAAAGFHDKVTRPYLELTQKVAHYPSVMDLIDRDELSDD
jgi:hypothetical protein